MNAIRFLIGQRSLRTKVVLLMLQDRVCDQQNKGNEGNTSSTNRTEMESDQVKIECYGKVKVEQSDEIHCMSSNVGLDEWSQASITNTAFRTGSSSARAASSQSLTSPGRFLSRFSFFPGNVSFRLSRATSLGSSRAYPIPSTSLRMLNDEKEIHHHPRSANVVIGVNETQQSSDSLPTSLINRTTTQCHEDMSASLQFCSRASDFVDNMRNSQPTSSGNAARDGGSIRMGVDENLHSSRMLCNLESIETRLSDRRIGMREPVERNVRFSRTLSVGRLRDRVLRRSSLSDFTFCPLQQDREVRDASQASRRQAFGGEMRVSESDSNAVTSPTASGDPSSGMSSSLSSIQDHEVETSRTREARYHDLLEHRSNFLERRRRIRSQVCEVAALSIIKCSFKIYFSSRQHK